MNLLIKDILLGTVFLLPLIGVYKGFGYEQIKVLFFIASISLICCLWMFLKPKFKWTNIKIAAFLSILTLLLTSILGINPQISILGNFPYFQGWILYSYLFLFSLLVSQFKIKLESWAQILVGSSTLVGLLAIKDWVLLNIFQQTVPVYAGRVVSSFGQPNFFAGFLLLTLPFSYFLLKNSDKKLRLLGWGSGVISLIGIMVSYSRSTILLALILLILGLMDQLKIKKFALAIFAVLVLAIFLSINLSSGFIWKEFLSPIQTLDPDLTKESVESRVYIWPQALKVGLEKPIFGHGLENIHLAFSDYFNKYKHPIFEENLKISPVLISLKDLNIDRTHNYVLDLWLFSGVLGGVSWLFLVFMLFKKLLQTSVLGDGPTSDRHQNVLIVSLVVYLFWIQFQNQSIVHLIYFWMLVGLIDQNS